MDLLPHAVDGLVGQDRTPDSPEPGDEAGLVATASGATWDGEKLRLCLHLAWRMEAREAHAFETLSDAFVLVLEDAARGAAAALPTADPHKKYMGKRSALKWRGPPPPPPPPVPESAGPPEEPASEEAERAEAAAAAAAMAGAEDGPGEDAATEAPELDGEWSGWLNVPLELGVAPADWAGPSVFLTARLHGLLSNTLAVELDPRAVKVASLFASRPWEPPREDAPAAPRPAPARAPALDLAPVPGAPPGRLEATLRLDAAELAAGGAEGWLRSVFVCAVLRGPELPFVAAWSAGRVLLDDDLALAGRGAEARLPVDLGTIFGRRLPKGTYDVQVSARQHRSALLEVTL